MAFTKKEYPILVTTQRDGADSAIINCGWNHYATYVRARVGLPLLPCAIIFVRTAEMMTCFGADRSNRFALRAIVAINKYRRYTARCQAAMKMDCRSTLHTHGSKKREPLNIIFLGAKASINYKGIGDVKRFRK